MQHSLKIWPEFYHAIRTGVKTCEVRKDDRGFQIGDRLLLLEWDPKISKYTGQYTKADVTDVVRHFDGLTPGYCVMSIRLPSMASGFSRALSEQNVEAAGLV